MPSASARPSSSLPGDIDPGDDSVKEGYRAFKIEGFIVLVSHAVIEHAEEYRTVRARIEDRLADARARMGPEAIRALSSVKIWVEWTSPDRRPRGPAEFHESAAWLADHGYDVAKEHGIEINTVEGFLHATATQQPQALLHELAHAYDSLVFHNRNPAIDAAYASALAGGHYDSVARIGSRAPERAYALNNAREYFAETSECYLGMNDYYPFVREQLESVDPTGFALMKSVWGARAPRPEMAALACAPRFSSAEGPPTAVVINNSSARAFEIFWLDEKGAATPIRQIPPGGSDVQPTYVGHVFEVRDAVTKACVTDFAGAAGVERLDLR